MRESLVRRVDDRLHPLGTGSWNPTSFGVRIAAVVAVLVGIVMTTVAARQAGPTIHPDEFGFLANGQVLIGHHEAPIPTGSFYPAGYGILTGLAALVTGSLEGAYRGALLLNVVLACLVAWLVRQLAERGFGASPVTARLAGLLVFVAPGTIVSAMFSWAEIAARAAFVGLIALVIATTQRLSASRSRQWVWGLGFFTGVMPLLHGRFTLVLPILCSVFVWWGWKRLTTRLTAMVAVCLTACGYVVSHLVNSFVKTTIYTTSYDQENRLLRRLVDVSVWPALVRTMTGQIWYLLSTSFGLVGVAVVWAGMYVWRHRRSLPHNPLALGMLVTLVSSAALIFTGGLQLLYGNRGDHLIYGRYVEILVPVLWTLGVVACERARRESLRSFVVVAAAIAAISVGYVLIDWGDGVKGGWARNDIVFPNIVGTDAMRYLVRPGLLTFGAAFAAGTVIVWWVGRKGLHRAVYLLIAVWSVAAVVSGQRSVLSRTDDFQASGVSVPTALAGIASPGGSAAQIGFDEGIRNDRSYYYLRYKLHPVRLVRFDVSSATARIPDSFRCVYAWGDRPPQGDNWQPIADEPVLGRVLFRRASAQSC